MFYPLQGCFLRWVCFLPGAGAGLAVAYPQEHPAFPGTLPVDGRHLSPLLARPSDDHFMQIMCIRKGKRLVARILPFLSPEQAADVLMATARNLPFLIKKDAQDEVRFQGLGGVPFACCEVGIGTKSGARSPLLRGGRRQTASCVLRMVVSSSPERLPEVWGGCRSCELLAGPMSRACRLARHSPASPGRKRGRFLINGAFV